MKAVRRPLCSDFEFDVVAIRAVVHFLSCPVVLLKLDESKLQETAVRAGLPFMSRLHAMRPGRVYDSAAHLFHFVVINQFDFIAHFLFFLFVFVSVPADFAQTFSAEGSAYIFRFRSTAAIPITVMITMMINGRDSLIKPACIIISAFVSAYAEIPVQTNRPICNIPVRTALISASLFFCTIPLLPQSSPSCFPVLLYPYTQNRREEFRSGFYSQDGMLCYTESGT